MEVVSDVYELKRILKEKKASVGFVPTMGALHNGHLSLINRSKKENEITVVSIFVNPKQFLEGEDFTKYPRRIEGDKDVCKRADVDILFIPDTESIYFRDEINMQAPKICGYIIEGFDRPGHFSGMLTVVMKLLHIVNPTRAYFGKKDAQQLFLIQKMVREYFLDTEIIPCDIVRESDGLAMSSRNAYLSKEGRNRALLIAKSLKKASTLIGQGELDPRKVRKEMEGVLGDLEIDYIEIVDREFKKEDVIKKGETLILVVARVEGVRLLDNLFI